MDRRQFLASGAALAIAARGSIAWAAEAGDAALVTELDRQFYEALPINPQNATALGLDKGKFAALKSRLNTYGEAGRLATLAFEKKGRAALQAIDPAALSGPARRQREIALYRAEAAIEPDRFGLSDVQMCYPVSQQNGAYFEVPDLITNQHTIETADDAEAYLSRLAAFSGVLDQQAEDQRAQAARGIVAPAWSLALALGQIRQLRAGAVEQNMLVRSLADRARAKGLTGDWERRAAAIVQSAVFPALDRHIALLDRLSATSPAGDGAWRMPQGDAIYAMALRQATTTNASPDEVHRTGLAQVAELSSRLDAILKQAGYTQGTVGARLAALNAAADQLVPNTDAGRTELIASLNAGLAKMATRLPQAFNRVPGEKLEVRRVPPEIQDGAPNGYYYSASIDGTRPAIYWINLKDTGDWPRYQQPSLTYHEGVPGHHLQGGYARMGGDLPVLLQNYFISAYGEGWALYSEVIAEGMGGYAGVEKAGALQSWLFRAARLVVDTGLHAMQWSREQATDYFVSTVAFTRARSQREIERYCVLPGQACSYKIGQNEWVRLRRLAEAELGAKFDARQFHEILKEGVMPLDMLDKRVRAWISRVKAA